MASLFGRYFSVLCESTAQAQRDWANVPLNVCEIKGCNSGLITLYPLLLRSLVLYYNLSLVVTATMSDTGTSKACVDIFPTTAADKEENTPLSLKIALPGHQSRGQSDIVNANICAEPLQMPQLQV